MKIPTAVEFLHNFPGEPDDDTIFKAMVEFAQLHVQAALESALEDSPYGSSTDTVSYKDMKDAILNSYPLTNIK